MCISVKEMKTPRNESRRMLNLLSLPLLMLKQFIPIYSYGYFRLVER
jgi:hypothetical protein